MSDFSAKQADEIFEEALSLPSEIRSSFIKKSCLKNTKLEDKIFKLLKAHNTLGSFLEGDAEQVRDSIYSELSTEWSNNSHDRTNTRVGNFKIIKEIGRGGGSTVYQGLREEQDWKQVSAIKILRRGIDTDDVLQRFHTERQILTNLKHPGIVSIQDAGVTDDGLPWFAMELIEGQNIYEHCQTKKLDLKNRLLIFLKILDVISFAHRHLIVHRDIKPSNILVTQDGKIKLLDFGISKVLDGSSEEIIKTYTRTNIYVATLDYAAPEQLERKNITTATDIYQLGLLLCKLLTGKLPVNNPENINESKIIIRPSELDTIQTSIKSRFLKGDVDTVILKTLRTEPEQRYASTDALIQDVQRIIENRPIEAQPPSLIYRFKKFLKRQPWALPIGMLASIGIASYVNTINLYNQQLQIERNLKAAEVVRTEKIKSFLVDFLKASDPYEGEGIDVTMKQALDNASEKADTTLSSQPEMQAEVYGTLAEVYKNLDLRDKSIVLWDKQIELLKKISNNPLSLLRARRERAQSIFIKQGDKKQALNELKSIKNLLINKFPNNLTDIIKANNYIGFIEYKSGDLNLAEEYFSQSVTWARSIQPNDKMILATSLLALSDVKMSKELFPSSLDSLDEAETILVDFYGEGTLQTIQVNTKKALILIKSMQDLNVALAIYEDASIRYKKLLGPTHQKTLAAMGDSAMVLGILGREDDAAHSYRNLLKIQIDKHDGKNALIIAEIMSNLSVSLSNIGELEEAEKMSLQAREMLQSLTSSDYYGLAYIDLTLSTIYLKKENYVELAKVSKRAREIFGYVMAPGNAMFEVSQCRYAFALIKLNNIKEGRDLLKKSIKAVEKISGIKRAIDECQGYLEDTTLL